MFFEMLLWWVMWPNQESLYCFTIDNKGSCFPARNPPAALFKQLCWNVSLLSVCQPSHGTLHHAKILSINQSVSLFICCVLRKVAFVGEC